MAIGGGRGEVGKTKCSSQGEKKQGLLGGGGVKVRPRGMGGRGPFRGASIQPGATKDGKITLRDEGTGKYSSERGRKKSSSVVSQLSPESSGAVCSRVQNWKVGPTREGL